MGDVLNYALLSAGFHNVCVCNIQLSYFETLSKAIFKKVQSSFQHGLESLNTPSKEIQIPSPLCGLSTLAGENTKSPRLTMSSADCLSHYAHSAF